MTVPPRTIARSALYVSLVFHLLVFGADLAVGSYHQAAWTVVAVVGLTSWLVIFPKLEQRLDADASRNAHLLLAQLLCRERVGTWGHGVGGPAA